MAKNQKFYVVWVGAKPGIYTTWDSAKAQINGFPAAKYKAFATQQEAETAFKNSYTKYYDFSKKTGDPSVSASKTVANSSIIRESLCVDAACSGNPGLMEYRGVYQPTGEQIFHQGPFPEGTNNIGEFLALVHALAYLEKQGRPTMPIYSDSRTAISWVRQRKAKTKLEQTPRNKPIFDLLERALAWLNTHSYQNPILKWETDKWGEIPADFGRK